MSGLSRRRLLLGAGAACALPLVAAGRALASAVDAAASDGPPVPLRAKFAAIFALTQVPLAVIEGLVTVVVVNVLTTHHRPELRGLAIFAREGG